METDTRRSMEYPLDDEMYALQQVRKTSCYQHPTQTISCEPARLDLKSQLYLIWLTLMISSKWHKCWRYHGHQ